MKTKDDGQDPRWVGGYTVCLICFNCFSWPCSFRSGRWTTMILEAAQRRRTRAMHGREVELCDIVDMLKLFFSLVLSYPEGGLR